MKLYFKQRMFSWFDSYDIYHMDESGAVAFTVEGKLAWGHCLHILDPIGRHIATVQQQVFTFLPKFDLYIGEQCVGTIRKAGGGQLHGMGLHHCGRGGTAGGLGVQGTVPLDGYLRHRRGRGGECPVRADGGAGHRRGEVLAELSRRR